MDESFYFYLSSYLSYIMIWFWISSSLRNAPSRFLIWITYLSSSPNWGRSGWFKGLSKLQDTILSAEVSKIYSSSIAETWKNEFILNLVEHKIYGISCIRAYQLSPSTSEVFNMYSIRKETSFCRVLLRAV